MRLTLGIFLMITTGCASARMVNYPGKHLPDANAPVTDISKPGVVAFKIRSTVPLESRRADAYELMFAACKTTKYTILGEGRLPQDAGLWAITFKCDGESP